MFPSVLRSVSAPQAAKREEESMKTRKLILKAGASAKRQEIAAKEVAKTNDSVMQRYKELKKFTKKSKAQRKEISQKAAWIEGAQYLINQEQHLERDIATILENVIISSFTVDQRKSTQLSSPSKSNAESLSFQQLVRNCVDEYQSNRNRRVNDFKMQMKSYNELKDMLNRTKGAITTLKSGKSADSEPDPRLNAATSVFADILRQISQAHSVQGMDLAAQYVSCQQDVQAEFMKICAMKSDSKKLINSERLENELEINPETDTPEVFVAIQDWRGKLEAIDDETKDSLAQLDQEKEAIQMEYCKRTGCDMDDCYGGWTESEHQIMVKELKRAQIKGISRSKLTETLISQLPHKSADDISRHEDWYKCLKSVQERKKLQIQKMESQFNEILEQAKPHLQTLRNKIYEERLLNEERERHELARAELHKLLHLQRAKKIEDLQHKLLENQELKRKIDEEKQREEERRLQEIQQTKALAEQYRVEKLKYLEAQREAEKIRHEEEERLRKQKIEEAKPNILHREQLRQQKLDEIRRKEEILLAEELRRGELLNKLAEQVPYYENIQAVESKLDHITVAADAQKYFKPDEETRGHLALNGFTDKKLFRDARFRLGLALREAGVHQSAAAAAVIAQLHPRQQAPW